MRPPPSLLFLVLVGLLSTCTGCLDLPGPVPDGQIYRCAVLDSKGDEIDAINQCGPWDDWLPAAELTAELYPDNCIYCHGTKIPCAWRSEP